MSVLCLCCVCAVYVRCTVCPLIADWRLVTSLQSPHKPSFSLDRLMDKAKAVITDFKDVRGNFDIS